MPTADARITTDRASRYLVQLCRHASQMGHGFPAHGGPHMSGERPGQIAAKWSETDGSISLDWGTCTLQATPEALTLHVEADDVEHLQRIQALLTRNIARMGRRDDLTVNWRRPDGTPGETLGPPRRRRHTAIALALAAVLAVAVHAGLAAGVLAIPQWASLGADTVLAIVVVMVLAKIALVVVHLRRRHRTSAKVR
jgi:hypothetical protein